MQFLEKDLEEIIFKASDEDLEERGFFISGKRFRQFRIGNYGIADLITVDKVYKYGDSRSSLEIFVYEFKKDFIDLNTFMQAIRYCQGISRYLEKRGFYNYNLNIVLCGKYIDTKSEFVYLKDLIYGDEPGHLSTLKFYTYQYEFDGIKFKSHSNYCLSNEGF